MPGTQAQIDPSIPTAVPWSRVVDASFLLWDLLQELGLQCLPKLTGGKGVHVVLPFGVPAAGGSEQQSITG